nr:MAG TPA: hypothetical protein [Caudoviricetes sp.]
MLLMNLQLLEVLVNMANYKPIRSFCTYSHIMIRTRYEN